MRNKNIKVLKNLYSLRSLGYTYIDTFSFYDEKVVDVGLPDDMLLLKKFVENCSLCNLSKTRTNVLFGDGSVKNVDIMIVTFSPTDLEDKEGRFYTGKAGELLSNIVNNVFKKDIGEVFITSLLKCKTNPNEKNLGDSIQKCRRFLFSQIKLVQPKIVLLFGENVYNNFTLKNDFDTIKGEMFDLYETKILATYEHLHILKNPTLKKEVLDSMLKVKLFLEY